MCGGIFSSHPCWDMGSWCDVNRLLTSTFLNSPAVVLLAAGFVWRTGPQSHGQQVLGRWSKERAECPVPICPHYPLPHVTVPREGKKVYLASVQSPATVKPELITTFHHPGVPLHSVLLRTHRGLWQPAPSFVQGCGWSLCTLTVSPLESPHHPQTRAARTAPLVAATVVMVALVYL